MAEGVDGRGHVMKWWAGELQCACQHHALQDSSPRGRRKFPSALCDGLNNWKIVRLSGGLAKFG